MRAHRFLATLIVTAILFPFGCHSGMAATAVIPAGQLMAESIQFEFAIYYLAKPSRDPGLALRQQVPAVSKELKVVDQVPATLAGAYVRARIEKNVQQNYRPPDIRSLQYFGRGLTATQAQALQASTQALILSFHHPKQKAWDALRTANELVERLARETGGLVWDDETREVFTAEQWRIRRLDSWKGGVPDVSKQTVIHAYKNTDFVRAITLGMAKLGLPDVVVDEFSWSLNGQVGNVMNSFCQAIAEGASVGRNGDFDLNLKAIRHPDVREAQTQSLKANAKAIALLSLQKAVPEEGDPANRLIRITADRYPGGDSHAKQENLIASLYGWEDSVAYIRHTDALREASENARSKLPGLKRAFGAGLQPGEFIQVKAPFPIPGGGNEWMWVEVVSWKGNAIEGLLKNEPFNIPTLHGGQIVRVQESQVFDYIRRLPDGSQEGNETGKIIEKMQGQRQP